MCVLPLCYVCQATVVEAMRRTMSMALLPNLPTSGPNTPSHSTDVQHT